MKRVGKFVYFVICNKFVAYIKELAYNAENKYSQKIFEFIPRFKYAASYAIGENRHRETSYRPKRNYIRIKYQPDMVDKHRETRDYFQNVFIH